MARRRAAAGGVLAVPALPFLFHETVFVRYALPVVVLVAASRSSRCRHWARGSRSPAAPRCRRESDLRAATAGGLRAQCLAGVRGVPRHAACTARAAARQRDAAAPNTPSGLARRQAPDGVVPACLGRRSATVSVRSRVAAAGPTLGSGGTEPVWLLADLSRSDVRLFDWRTTRLAAGTSSIARFAN